MKFKSVICLFFFLSSLAHGATVPATSCSSAHVQTAVNSAGDGDTVTVPAGSCTWTGFVAIPDTKGVTVQGAGTTQTTITTNGGGFNIQTDTGNELLRITGFRFEHSVSSSYIHINGLGQNWRIDNNIFDDNDIYGAYTIRVGNGGANGVAVTYGVIDNNQFINRNYATSIFIEWPKGVDDPAAAGDWIWSQTAERGTAQAVYIEDNIFSGDSTASQVVDGRWGVKYVLRYNEIHNPWISTHSACTNQGRDPIWTEVYKNSFTDDTNRYGGSQIEMRSTSGIIWGNTSDTTLNKFVLTIDHERSYKNCSGPYGDWCDGIASFDENVGLHGYRCLGQPGWGPPQASDMSNPSFSGMFAWDNMDAVVQRDLGIANNNDYTSEHLQFGRELFNESDMSVGVISARPSTCDPGPTDRDIYLSTDENAQGATIYVCTATNTWDKHWEPYTYPHPLIGGALPNSVIFMFL